MYYIGEKYAEKYQTAGPPVRGADGQHISLSAQVLMQNTRVPPQRAGEQVLDCAQEQAKKALSTGSGRATKLDVRFEFVFSVGLT